MVDNSAADQARPSLADALLPMANAHLNTEMLIAKLAANAGFEGDFAIEPDVAAFFNTRAEPVWIKDARGRYIYVNRAMETCFGRSHDELIGKTDFELFAGPFAEVAMRQDLQTMTATKVLHFLPTNMPSARSPLSGFSVTKVSLKNASGNSIGVAAVAKRTGPAPDIMEISAGPAPQEDLPSADVAGPTLVSQEEILSVVETCLARQKDGGSHFAVMSVQIRARRSVDPLVHKTVPEVLWKTTCSRLQQRIRKTGTVYFMGNGRFTILVPEVANPADVTALAAAVSDDSFVPAEVDGVLYQFLASIAYTVSEGRNENAFEIFARLLDRLREEKTPGMAEASAVFPLVAATAGTASEYELETEMRSGIQRGEFTAYFQPKIDIQSQQVIGAEALVRWKHPRRGLIPPSMFIPLAGQTGLLQAVNLQVWQQSLQFAVSLNQNAAHSRRVAINISAYDLQCPNFLSIFMGLMKETGCPADFVEFEITESALKGRTEQLEIHLAGLADVGIGLAIDDFGTGNLAFAALTQFPIRTLKIDRVYVKDIATDEKTRRLIRSMCLMADELGLVTVAEGVETLMESELVKQIGCKQGQGYFWQRPVPADQFFEWLNQRPIVQ